MKTLLLILCFTFSKPLPRILVFVFRPRYEDEVRTSPSGSSFFGIRGAEQYSKWVFITQIHLFITFLYFRQYGDSFAGLGYSAWIPGSCAGILDWYTGNGIPGLNAHFECSVGLGYLAWILGRLLNEKKVRHRPRPLTLDPWPRHNP